MVALGQPRDARRRRPPPPRSPRGRARTASAPAGHRRPRRGRCGRCPTRAAATRTSPSRGSADLHLLDGQRLAGLAQQGGGDLHLDLLRWSGGGRRTLSARADARARTVPPDRRRPRPGDARSGSARSAQRAAQRPHLGPALGVEGHGPGGRRRPQLLAGRAHRAPGQRRVPGGLARQLQRSRLHLVRRRSASQAMPSCAARAPVIGSPNTLAAIVASRPARRPESAKWPPPGCSPMRRKPAAIFASRATMRRSVA